MRPMRNSLWWTGVVGLWVPVAGCSFTLSERMDVVRNRATFDLECPAAQVQVVQISSDERSFGASGCGKRAAYVLDGPCHHMSGGETCTPVLNSPNAPKPAQPSGQ